MDSFMKVAFDEAYKGMKKNHGGPFGAVVVKNGKIISKAHNEVIKRNDPTAHAEMLAIRKAAKKMKTFDLSGCILYTTCEPCPMCLAAIYWARIKEVFYECTRNDAKKAGFDDEYIYQAIKGNAKTDVKINRISQNQSSNLFQEWKKKKDKVQY